MGHMNIGTVDGAISVSPQVQQAVCCPKLDLGQAEHHNMRHVGACRLHICIQGAVPPEGFTQVQTRCSSDKV